ncbi:dihydropteroate synthase (plasmid) [Pseudorhodobacter turbinis]|uniref:Dihydropteroate synthase n=1 Tax=Pseudorhodobacter turbinis TaxID=2500533 RepID=A0A4P8EIM7_9RHOB|nr:dihydropteroate synthase [Pseudorhodobacter turbinis]QCO56991.1 dihydropteroate synthase [Pseudorhodobacter turbinis]
MRWRFPQPVLSPPDTAVPLAGSRFVRFEGDASDDLSRLPAPICGLSMDCPRIMGILNVTPDSFSDGGDLASVQQAVARARLMDAADILDIGGESTRPGAQTVSVAEEIARVAPAIRGLRDAGITKPISIDTRKAAVAEAALDAGADIVNDVTAFRYDPEMADLVAERGVPACLMHSKDDPATMQDNPTYADVVAEVMDHLAERVAFARSRGVGQLIVDPGIGFAKTQAHNLDLLRHLSVLHGLGLPVLLGASRKKFIGAIGGATEARDRMPGSVAVALHGAAMGVQILRVHDVAQTAQALALWKAMQFATE